MKETYLEIIKNIMTHEGVDNYEIKNIIQEFNGDNYMGTMERKQATGQNKSGKTVMKHFCIKMAPTNRHVRNLVSIHKFYCTEVNVYQNVFPKLEKLQTKFEIPSDRKFPFIKFYDASLQEPDEFLIMEDVGPDGFVLHPRKESFDLDHMKIVLQYLARFHALSFALRKLEPKIYKEMAKSVEKYGGYSETFHQFVSHSMKNALYYIENAKYRDKFEKEATYDKYLKRASPKFCDPFNVFTHGDFWKNNIIFKYKNGKPIDVRFVDWQVNRHASPVTDLSHILFSATEKCLRDQHYDNLINLYYSTLSESLEFMGCKLNEIYPETIFRQHLKDVLIYGLVLGTIGLTFSLRESEDIEDLETSVKNVVDNDEYDFTFKNPSSAKKFSNSVLGVIEDFVGLGII